MRSLRLKSIPRVTFRTMSGAVGIPSAWTSVRFPGIRLDLACRPLTRRRWSRFCAACKATTAFVIRQATMTFAIRPRSITSLVAECWTRPPGPHRAAACWGVLSTAIADVGLIAPLSFCEPADSGSESQVVRRHRGSQREILAMPPPSDLGATLLAAWRTNSRVTAYLVEHVPAGVWDVPLPGAQRRTARMIAGHLHNARCMWIKTLGQEHGIATPTSVDRRKVSRHELLLALQRSSRGIEALIELGIAAGGHLPPSKAYVWRNLPLDVAHVLTYFVAHEGHHRGQIVMLARQLGHRLPTEISAGLWQWTKRVQEVRGARG
jgi:uncharacterized damage-inducible protein DinB